MLHCFLCEAIDSMQISNTFQCHMCRSKRIFFLILIPCYKMFMENQTIVAANKKYNSSADIIMQISHDLSILEL